MAVSGTGVGVATAGGVLLYAGLTGLSPLAALRSIASGRPAAPSQSSSVSTAVDAVAAGAASSLSLGVGMAASALVNAATANIDDKYSQARRWQKGYSDCSSFVGKAFLAIGITPPGASVTGSYLAWSACVKVDPAQVQAGDLICNSNHIIIATGNLTGIGQENPSINVQEGTIADLMYGTGAWIALRYVSPTPAPVPGGSAGAQR
jgi:cell wall-associated NlpC family hydrolase